MVAATGAVMDGYEKFSNSFLLGVLSCRRHVVRQRLCVLCVTMAGLEAGPRTKGRQVCSTKYSSGIRWDGEEVRQGKGGKAMWKKHATCNSRNGRATDFRGRLAFRTGVVLCYGEKVSGFPRRRFEQPQFEMGTWRTPLLPHCNVQKRLLLSSSRGGWLADGCHVAMLPQPFLDRIRGPIPKPQRRGFSVIKHGPVISSGGVIDIRTVH